MSKKGILITDVELKAPAEKLFELWCARPHHITHATPEKVQACNLHKGDFGKTGSIISWNYVHDGEAKVLKELLEKVDHDNKTIVYNVIGGEVLNDFKTFKITLEIKEKGEGSITHLTFEYEKLHVGIGHPETFVDLVINVFKDIDDHIVAKA